MRLLVVSHPCVTPINQQFYAQVQEHAGWELAIVTPNRWKNEYHTIEKVERWPQFKGELITLPIWNRGNLPLHFYRDLFASTLRRFRPDAIYVHHEPYAVATAQTFLANRLSINRPFGYYSAQNILKQYPPPFRWWERRILKESAFAFPVSSSVQGVLESKGAANTTLLPLTVDPALFRPVTHDGDSKANLGLKKELAIGFVGRISSEKGVSTLLRALERLSVPKWQALFVGAGPLETAVDAANSRDPRIRRRGYVPHHEIASLLSALDVLVVPSETTSNWKEQFGRVVIEAMACGTPVLGSDSGEIPHLIELTGGGLIFPERDSVALAKQLSRLLNDGPLREKCSAAGRDAVLKRFTLKQSAEVFCDTIAAAVGNFAPQIRGAALQ